MCPDRFTACTSARASCRGSTCNCKVNHTFQNPSFPRIGHFDTHSHAAHFLALGWLVVVLLGTTRWRLLETKCNGQMMTALPAWISTCVKFDSQYEGTFFLFLSLSAATVLTP